MTKWTNKAYDICAIGPQDNSQVAGNTGAAAAAVTTTIAHDGTNTQYLLYVQITSTNPAATVNGAVTITGLVGGTITYEFVESSQNGGNLVINPGTPMPAVNPSTDIVISVPAITSGGAVSIVAQSYKSTY